MVQFSKLRLQGFKSFVEKTELEIMPGLTGIVGPNGCGKSNLLEALRWLMASNSAKSMRSSSMDDVIFSGTANRPARNMAEVSLLLENRAHNAPAPYGNVEELEVVRRIERDYGSSYLINGKPVRQRDTQIFFADLASGANSPALVSQGKVAAIINAKPIERRSILEDSAGVAGLYARRHEAELKLRATETNLARVGDIMLNLEEQIKSLSKQSRQVQQYKKLSDSIQELEIALAIVEWQTAQEQVQVAMSNFTEAERNVADKMLAVTQLSRTLSTQEEDLPALRQAEAEASAAWQTRNIALQRLADEERSLEDAINEASQLLEQIERDRAYETSSLADFSAMLARMEEEEKGLTSQESHEEELNNLTEKQNTLDEAVRSAEQTYRESFQQFEQSKAQKNSYENKLRQDEARLASIRERVERLQNELAEKKANIPGNAELDETRTSVDTLDAQITAKRTRYAELQSSVASVRETLSTWQNKQLEAKRAYDRNKAEQQALERVTSFNTDNSFTPVLNEINVEAGFEKAFAQSFGEGLQASLDVEALACWLEAPASVSTPSAPSGTKQLSDVVKVPARLQKAVAGIGFVETAEEAQQVYARLQTGQSVVARDGSFWRWDGYHLKASANMQQSGQAAILEQKNKLEQLRNEEPALEQAVNEAQAGYDTAKAEEATFISEIQSINQEISSAERELQQARQSYARILEARSAAETQLAKLEENIRVSQEDFERIENDVATVKHSLSDVSDEALQDMETRVYNQRSALDDKRQELQNVMVTVSRLQQERDRRNARLHAIADERISIQNRTIRANEHLQQLQVREEATREKLTTLQDKPSSIKTRREELLSLLQESEAKKSEASDRLQEVESAVTETRKALRDAEAALSEVKEGRGRTEAMVENARTQVTQIETSIFENFEKQAEELRETNAEITAKFEGANRDELRAKREQQIRTRDNIGPVNLRADVELQEISERIEKVNVEKAELETAIDELRSAIQKLNKEAKERLTAAFDQVNTYFQSLFTRLFGGGKAHLEMIEGDDPSVAGLEIYAQPPGKNLTSLSLLSGGEQALTALSLILAMFLTNPAPVCVLDEVDAPLDDANVDRICDVLREIAEKSQTRFLVVTHHRLTMARMDRLFGVTMAERGVSQLVSVNMEQLDMFAEAA